MALLLPRVDGFDPANYLLTQPLEPSLPLKYLGKFDITYLTMKLRRYRYRVCARRAFSGVLILNKRNSEQTRFGTGNEK